MLNRYNIYHAMLRAAAGEGTPGAEDDADSTANAKTINAGDDDETSQEHPGDERNGSGEGEGAAAADGDKKPDTDAAEGDKKPPVVVPRDVMLRRVRELTTDKRTQAEKIAALEAENARLAASKPAGEDGAAGDDAPPARADYKTDAQFQAAVRAEAARLRQADEFNAKCNSIADAGEKDYKDTWNDAVANLKMLSDDGNIPWTLLNAALEADDPAKALHELGKNPEEAQRILGLTPIQQVAQVVKHGMKAGAAKPAKPRSMAPDPIDPISGGGGTNTNDGLGDDIDDETWMRNRNAQLKSAQRRA